MLALEVNAEWAALITARAKTVELRAWPLPSAAVGARVALLVPDTPGAPGAPSLAGCTGLGPDEPGAIAGWAVFGEPFRYESPAAAAADGARHRVPAGSPFLRAGGGNGGGSEGRCTLWGWPILAAGPAAGQGRPLPRGVRVHRSLWSTDAAL